jgi:hypothetical protein
MAAPRKKDGSAGALVIVGVAIVSIVAPIALLMAWIFTEIRARDGQLARLLEEGSVAPSHREEYARLSAEVSRARMQLNQAEASGVRAGLTIPGEFDSILEMAQQRLFQAELQLQSTLILLRGRWADIADQISQREGCRLAVIIWSSTFLLLFPLEPDWTPVERSAAASLMALVAGAFILFLRKAEVVEALQDG